MSVYALAAHKLAVAYWEARRSGSLSRTYEARVRYMDAIDEIKLQIGLEETAIEQDYRKFIREKASSCSGKRITEEARKL